MLYIILMLLVLLVVGIAFICGMKYGDLRFRKKMLHDILNPPIELNNIDENEYTQADNPTYDAEPSAVITTQDKTNKNLN